ncbi:transcription termination/antitermination factor NusG [Clostridium sp. CAG:299]|nr:transcription termination/antitermination factor NusG [Clostridium sp. CAG:299]
MVAELTDLYLDEKGEIVRADGPLRFFLDKIVKLNLRKRLAVTELTIAGRKQTAVFGIRLRREELQR